MSCFLDILKLWKQNFLSKFISPYIEAGFEVSKNEIAALRYRWSGWKGGLTFSAKRDIL